MSVRIAPTASTALTVAVVAGMFVTAPTAGSRPRVAVAPVALSAFTSGPVMSECGSCHGSDWCHHCGGTGAAGGNPGFSHGKSCHGCGGTGTCQHCLEPEPLVLVPGGKR
jgi:hypothetical protein